MITIQSVVPKFLQINKECHSIALNLQLRVCQDLFKSAFYWKRYSDKPVSIQPITTLCEIKNLHFLKVKKLFLDEMKKGESLLKVLLDQFAKKASIDIDYYGYTRKFPYNDCVEFYHPKIKTIFGEAIADRIVMVDSFLCATPRHHGWVGSLAEEKGWTDEFAQFLIPRDPNYCKIDKAVVLPMPQIQTHPSPQTLPPSQDWDSYWKIVYKPSQERAILTKVLMKDLLEAADSSEEPVSTHSRVVNTQGKWQLFVPLSQLDKTWEKVSDLTKKDRLGIAAKAATARPNSNALDTNIKVITVHTKNYNDLVDVASIAWVLYEEKILTNGTLNYKTDAATHQGIYSNTASKNISRYSVGINSFIRNNSKESFTEFFILRYGTFGGLVELPPQTTSRIVSTHLCSVSHPDFIEDSPEDVGVLQWLVPVAKFDEIWKKVVELTLDRKLGVLSEAVSILQDPNHKAILLHTENPSSSAEVGRVAWAAYSSEIFSGTLMNFKSDAIPAPIWLDRSTLVRNNSENELVKHLRNLI